MTPEQRAALEEIEADGGKFKWIPRRGAETLRLTGPYAVGGERLWAYREAVTAPAAKRCSAPQPPTSSATNGAAAASTTSWCTSGTRRRGSRTPAVRPDQRPQQAAEHQ